MNNNLNPRVNAPWVNFAMLIVAIIGVVFAIIADHEAITNFLSRPVGESTSAPHHEGGLDGGAVAGVGETGELKGLNEGLAGEALPPVDEPEEEFDVHSLQISIDVESRQAEPNEVVLTPQSEIAEPKVSDELLMGQEDSWAGVLDVDWLPGSAEGKSSDPVDMQSDPGPIKPPWVSGARAKDGAAVVSVTLETLPCAALQDFIVPNLVAEGGVETVRIRRRLEFQLLGKFGKRVERAVGAVEETVEKSVVDMVNGEDRKFRLVVTAQEAPIFLAVFRKKSGTGRAEQVWPHEGEAAVKVDSGTMVRIFEEEAGWFDSDKVQGTHTFYIVALSVPWDISAELLAVPLKLAVQLEQYRERLVNEIKTISKTKVSLAQASSGPWVEISGQQGCVVDRVRLAAD